MVGFITSGKNLRQYSLLIHFKPVNNSISPPYLIFTMSYIIAEAKQCISAQISDSCRMCVLSHFVTDVLDEKNLNSMTTRAVKGPRISTSLERDGNWHISNDTSNKIHSLTKITDRLQDLFRNDDENVRRTNQTFKVSTNSILYSKIKCLCCMYIHDLLSTRRCIHRER